MNALEAAVVAGRSTRAAVWWEDAQGSAGLATTVKHMPFLVVARSTYSDYPSVQSSRSSDQVLAAQCTDAGNDGESSAAG
jgi:hypothetical protein